MLNFNVRGTTTGRIRSTEMNESNQPKPGAMPFIRQMADSLVAFPQSGRNEAGTLYFDLEALEADDMAWAGFRKLYGPRIEGMTRQEQLSNQFAAGAFASVLEQAYVDRLTGVCSENQLVAEVLHLFAASEGVAPTAFKTAISRAIDTLKH